MNSKILVTKTRSCSAFEHPEIRFECDDSIPKADLNALLCFLEASVEGGERFEDGHTISFGSMLLRVSTGGGKLILHEPDMQGVPISWRNDVTSSLRLLRQQKDIADSVGLVDELDCPSICSSLLVGTDVTEKSDSLVLDRVESANADSGWFIGRLDSESDYNDPTNLQRISIYEAFLQWPRVAGYLGLPPGCRVELSGSHTEIFRDDELLEIREGSLLDAAHAPTRGDRLH